MIFKLQVGLPKSPNLGQVLNFHTQSVHFLLTLQLRQLAKTTTTLQTFSVHFSEVKLFCCLSLLRLRPAGLAVIMSYFPQRKKSSKNCE